LIKELFRRFNGFSVVISLCLLMFCYAIPLQLQAQEPELMPATDTIPALNDTLIIQPDRLQTSLRNDQPAIPERVLLEDKVQYKAADSMYFDLVNNKTYLFYNAEIQYTNINLQAHYIEIDFSNNLLHASGLPDSAGVMQGTPVFTEGQQSFIANQMSYNFDTKRGFIRSVITQEGDGFLHGKVVKKMEDDVTNVSQGSYTTCNLDCPHFEFRYRKAKVIPGSKIITGPVFLVIEDVPLPLAVPFGYFPNKKGQASGIKIPSYGEASGRGFYLENGGYYWGISDYMELNLLGDIYSRGSWALKPELNYRKRYKYNGRFSLNLANNVTGEEGTPSYSKRRDFAVRWNHNQDPKAHPTQRFSANVNIQSSRYNRFNPVSFQDFQSNTFQSSISYQRTFAGKYFLNVSATHSQNTSSNSVTMTLPDVSFNATRFYPFRRKNRIGSLKWYEEISVNYIMNARNQITTVDSLLFRPESMQDFRNGVKHSIPITSNVKVLKHFNLGNSINFTERWYSQRYEKRWVTDDRDESGESLPGYLATDTLHGFYGVRDFSYTASLSTTLYGMKNFKRGPVRAFRHVMNPSVGFSLRPDFGTPFWNYWGEVVTDIPDRPSEEVPEHERFRNFWGEQEDIPVGRIHRYSHYANSIWGAPPDGRSGSLSLGLSNNIEMKVRAKNDTVTGVRKVKLFDNLSVNTAYDLARDSLRWSSLNVSARTTLFRNLSVQFTGRWNPYALDSLGRMINKFVWETDHKILRRENTTWNFSFRYSLNSSTFASKGAAPAQPDRTTEFGTPEELEQVMTSPDEFIDWTQPWSFSFDYSLRLNSQFAARTQAFENTTVQSVSFNGDVNLTPKWKIGFRSGYDFTGKQFTTTSFNFYRDLHCWEMRFNWIPIGGMKSWNFQINVKSPMLQDLKLSRKKDFRDF
jgi:hypothetical protein